MSASASSSSSAGVSTPGPSEAAAGVGRRVQPRHFHAGPNPPAATDSDAAAATAVALPPVARLYRHALECVFAFLRQGELVAALQVSRGWLAAVESMASLQLVVGRPVAELRFLVTSAVGRHVSVLGSFDNGRAVALTGDTLFLLARFMPHLRSLACDLTLPPSAGPLLFPANLRKLEVNLRVSAAVTAADINTTLRAISRLPLLQSLTILVTTFDAQISFAPLAALLQLRVLEIRSAASTELSDAQVDELRALPQLQKVSPSLTTSMLRRLLHQPHHLQWQQISLPMWLDDESVTLLPLLPSLTKLNGLAQCSRFDWLRGLPNLTHVILRFSDSVDTAGRSAPLVAGLQHCSNIEILSLAECPDLTAAQLAGLLPRLPRLRELELRGLSIDSLAFLAKPPLTTQLRILRLENCDQLPLVELFRVRALLGLKVLNLYHSFTTRMDSFSRSLFQPPSLLLPQLEHFDYVAPEVVQEDEPEDQ